MFDEKNEYSSELKLTSFPCRPHVGTAVRFNLIALYAPWSDPHPSAQVTRTCRPIHTCTHLTLHPSAHTYLYPPAPVGPYIPVPTCTHRSIHTCTHLATQLMQDASAELQAQLGVRYAIIQGLMRDKDLAEREVELDRTLRVMTDGDQHLSSAHQQ